MNRKSLIALSVVCAGLVGCGSKLGTISGDVSYDGQPVEDGQITFSAEDGQSAIVGGPIRNGKYRVENVPPGAKLVQIEAVKAVPFARSNEEMAKRYEEQKAKGNATGLIDPADIIPPNAEGNNVRIEIKQGEQIQHFHLKKPG